MLFRSARLREALVILTLMMEVSSTAETSIMDGNICIRDVLRDHQFIVVDRIAAIQPRLRRTYIQRHIRGIQRRNHKMRV